MAQKRMLNKSISLSGQVNRLTLKQKLFFTWAIPHLDDFGLIDSSPEVLKATVCPMVKEIGVSDIRQFIDNAKAIGLIEVYDDCLEFTGFVNHQSISQEKKAKSKFSKIPQKNIGEPKKIKKSPVQENRIEEKIREDKRIEVSESPPSQKSEEFFLMVEANGNHLQSFVEEFSKKYKLPTEYVVSEIKKFTNYWTELTKDGGKERWELQKTFEVQKRLATWFNNQQKWSRNSPTRKQRTIV